MSDRRKVLPQYVMPKRGLTAFAGHVASRERGATTTRLVRWFVRKYGVDMSEAAVPDVAAYRSFNDFFTRALKEGARPIADADLVCPVDGTISQFGRIEHDQILQAKGHRYSTRRAGRRRPRARGALSRRQLRDALPEPEGLPPHPHAVRRRADANDPRPRRAVLGQSDDGARRAGPVRAQRARRLRLRFAAVGTFVLTLVGATIVGSMATVWHGAVHLPRVRRVREWHYADGAVVLKKGEEMGRFLLGSTVVLLFPTGDLRFDPGWQPGGPVRFGAPMAEPRPARPLTAVRAVFVDATPALESARAAPPRSGATPALEIAFGRADIVPKPCPRRSPARRSR